HLTAGARIIGRLTAIAQEVKVSDSGATLLVTQFELNIFSAPFLGHASGPPESPSLHGPPASSLAFCSSNSHCTLLGIQTAGLHLYVSTRRAGSARHLQAIGAK